MSGLEQRLPLIRFELEHSASGVTNTRGREDITTRVVGILQRELGLSLSDCNRLVACTDVFEGRSGGAERMCREMGVPFLGRIPMDPSLGRASEKGLSISDQTASSGSTSADPPLCQSALMSIVDSVQSLLAGLTS